SRSLSTKAVVRRRRKSFLSGAILPSGCVSVRPVALALRAKSAREVSATPLTRYGVAATVSLSNTAQLPSATSGTDRSRKTSAPALAVPDESVQTLLFLSASQSWNGLLVAGRLAYLGALWPKKPRRARKPKAPASAGSGGGAGRALMYPTRLRRPQPWT